MKKTLFVLTMIICLTLFGTNEVKASSKKCTYWSGELNASIVIENNKMTVKHSLSNSEFTLSGMTAPEAECLSSIVILKSSLAQGKTEYFVYQSSECTEAFNCINKKNSLSKTDHIEYKAILSDYTGSQSCTYYNDGCSKITIKYEQYRTTVTLNGNSIPYNIDSEYLNNRVCPSSAALIDGVATFYSHNNATYKKGYSCTVETPFDNSGKYSCGGGMIKNIPARLIKITSTIVNVIKIAVPIIIVILGMIDLAKGVISQKEDEIKKGQKVFVKRLITGVILFFVVLIVQILVDFVDKDSENVMSCVRCFINSECSR